MGRMLPAIPINTRIIPKVIHSQSISKCKEFETVTVFKVVNNDA
jgi:hypothetical protein